MNRLANTALSDLASRLRVAALGGVLVLLGVAAAVAQPGRAFELRNGVVVASGAGMVYFMNTSGGIDAVDLETGNVAWRSAAAARPISVSAAGLLAQVESPTPGRLELALLDGSGQVIKSSSVALPQGVEAPVADGLSHRFLVRGTAAGGQTRVDWQSMIIPPRGALIRDGGEVAQLQSGGFALDPVSGAVSNAVSRDGGLAMPSVVVPAGQSPTVPGQHYLSADGNYRMASVVANGTIPDLHDWALYDASGNRIGQVSVRAAYAPFHVSSGVVLVVTEPGGYRQEESWVEEPLALRSMSLTSGLELWSFAVRDSSYQGPYPP